MPRPAVPAAGSAGPAAGRRPTPVPAAPPAAPPCRPGARRGRRRRPGRRRRAAAALAGALALALLLLAAWRCSAPGPRAGPSGARRDRVDRGAPSSEPASSKPVADLEPASRADLERPSAALDAAPSRTDAVRERVAPTCHAGPLGRRPRPAAASGRGGPERPEQSRAQLLRPGPGGHGCRLGAAHGPLPPHDGHESGLLRAVLVRHRAVQVTDVSSTAPSSVVATLRYDYGTVAPSWNGPPTGSCERTAG